MKSLFNLIALIAVGFTMFYLGKSCSLSELEDIPTVDSSAIRKLQNDLDLSNQYIDSIKEENREMDRMIVGYQDTIATLVAKMATTGGAKKQYKKVRQTVDTPQIVVACDSLANEYAIYREACDAFVIESDSIITALYKTINNEEKIIEEQSRMIGELSNKYMTAFTTAQISATGEQLQKRRKNKWKGFSLWLAATLGLVIIAN